MLDVELIKADSEYPDIIRSLIISDAESMHQIAYYSTDEGWAKSFSRGHLFLVMKEQDELIGFADLTLDSENPYFYFAYWVNPSKRGLGYGKQIISTMLSWVRENTRGVYGIAIVQNDNVASSHVLLRNNFKLDDTRDGFQYYTIVVHRDNLVGA